ncbi:MAG: branched-chain amino acid aminotransferase [Acidobacteriota bacterium]|nr:branched-chain amino acid aminotransferase [Acidobacteriota bacterium]
MIDIAINRVPESRLASSRWQQAPFGTVFTDHMFLASYMDGAWGHPRIEPYGPVELWPSLSALHYAQSVFEGLKAFRQDNGRVVLFRPAANAARFSRSMTRLAMPPVPEDLFLEALHRLVALDAAWVPAADQGALYIRPFAFGADEGIRARPADRYLFMIIACPAGAYYDKPVKVRTMPQFSRAFEGGTGDVKPAGNYAPALLAEQLARAAGADSVLWLDGREHRWVEECGVMNVFFVIDGTVVTPALGGTILPGITRDSVITLLRDQGYAVDERRIAIDEVFEAADHGRLQEAFGVGTAAVVSPIAGIMHEGHAAQLPPVDRWTVAPFAKTRLADLRRGAAEDTHGWMVAVD